MGPRAYRVEGVGLIGFGVYGLGLILRALPLRLSMATQQAATPLHSRAQQRRRAWVLPVMLLGLAVKLRS